MPESDRGEGYRYEVSGVYFAIPNYYLKTYGNWDGDEELHGLYAVSGSYRESRINGIVTDSEAVYTAAQQVAGKSIKWYGYDQHDTADIRERNGVIYRDDFPLHFYWDLYWNEPGVDDYRVRASYNIPAEIGGFISLRYIKIQILLRSRIGCKFPRITIQIISD